jgi:hypothetical protein
MIYTSLLAAGQESYWLTHVPNKMQLLTRYASMWLSYTVQTAKAIKYERF